jgi:hypothetical protein
MAEIAREVHAGLAQVSNLLAGDDQRGQRLRAKGAVLCDNTTDLILRSRRAIDRSRVLLRDARRLVDRPNRDR